MSDLIDEATLITHCQRLLKNDRRTFLAIAGAPGSGKSTLVERLARKTAVQSDEDPRVAILPMDGFHYDDSILKARGRLHRKGAPDTFDVSGLRSTLMRLADPAEGNMAVPVFDRKLEVSRGSARIIPQSVQLVLVEGNYLLLDEDPWRSLHPMFDLKVIIDVPEEELARRLRKRWVQYGLDETQIASKLDDNDLPNGRAVREKSVMADYRLVQSER